MDRFKYCYGRKRGQKVENDARWIALCEEKQKIKLELSFDEESGVEDKENFNSGKRASRRTINSNKFFPSRSARPKLDLSECEDEENPDQSQDPVLSKPLPIEDEIRKTEDAFSVFGISDDSDSNDINDKNDDDDDDNGGGCDQMLDDRTPMSVETDKNQVDDDDGQSDNNEYSATTLQASEGAHLDEEDDDEDGSCDDDYDDDNELEGNEETDSESWSSLPLSVGEESCEDCPSAMESQFTTSSINYDISSFLSVQVGETSEAGGYEADDDTHFHSNQNVTSSILVTLTHDVTSFELGDPLDGTDVEHDFDGESFTMESAKINTKRGSYYNEASILCSTCVDESSIRECDTCTEETIPEGCYGDSSDDDDDCNGGSEASELCDTCIDKTGITECSTCFERTHLESFPGDNDKKRDDSDSDCNIDDNDPSLLCDTCIANSSIENHGKFIDETQLGDDDDDPDGDCDDDDDHCDDIDDDDCKNYTSASCNTFMDESRTVECNTSCEKTVLGSLGDHEEDDDDVHSDYDSSSKIDDSQLCNTCIASSERDNFSDRTYSGNDSDDDHSHVYSDDGGAAIEAAHVSINDDDDDDDEEDEEDNDVSIICDTHSGQANYTSNNSSSFSKDACLERSSNNQDGGNDVTCIVCNTCIAENSVCISGEEMHSQNFVDDDIGGDETSAFELKYYSCVEFSPSGASTLGVNNKSYLRVDGDDSNDELKNSARSFKDVSQVESLNHNGCIRKGSEVENLLGDANFSSKDVMTFTCNDDCGTRDHIGGGDDDDDNGSTNEITISSQTSILTEHDASVKHECDDDDAAGTCFDNDINEDDDDDACAAVACNFDDLRNDETVGDEIAKDDTIVPCDDFEILADNGRGEDLSTDENIEPTDDIVTSTVDVLDDPDVLVEQVMAIEEDDGEMVAEDDILPLVSLSIMEASFKRDRRPRRKSSWRVFVGNDDDDDVHTDRDGVDRTLTRFDESACIRKSVNPRFSIARTQEDMRKLSETLQHVGDVDGSSDPRSEILKFCGQKKILNFANVFTKKWMKSCKKIGEGAYAEVFQLVKNDETMAIKVIPVRNEDDNEDVDQQSFREILFEMTISRELTRLRSKTEGFVDLRSVWFVSGKYPKVLMDAWDEYDEERNSENDRPDFQKEQHYVVLGFEMGGVPLESFGLTDHLQVLSIVQQISLSLAIAEEELRFEHRDLHLGNVLVRQVDPDGVLSFVHAGRRFEVRSRGLKVIVIDYTLSRMTRDGCTFFKDLSTDTVLFEGQGDIQYDVYRDMKKITGNNWTNFTPATNVLWLKHTVDKVMSFAQQCPRSGTNQSNILQGIVDLTYKLSNELKQCHSACDFVTKSFIFSDDFLS